MKIENFFDLTLSNEDVENPKPNSEIYVKAMSRLNSLSDRTIIFEDNENGIKSALDSGAHVIKVNGVNDINLQCLDFLRKKYEF
jgi:HAD superfamily hydrolase (TIGR01509 family)